MLYREKYLREEGEIHERRRRKENRTAEAPHAKEEGENTLITWRRGNRETVEPKEETDGREMKEAAR